MMLSRSQIILASTSKTRRKLLEDAGARLIVTAPMIDETIVKQSIAGSEPADVAMILAQAKAMSVSEVNRSAIVVGADQVLSLDDRIFDKPTNREEARDQLLDLRGKRHVLTSAVACAIDGNVIWSHDDEAQLAMRPFSNDFLGAYLAALDEQVYDSVGGYQLERLGSQLFEAVEGDFFTILGLPLLPLLEFLRSQNVMLT